MQNLLNFIIKTFSTTDYKLIGQLYIHFGAIFALLGSFNTFNYQGSSLLYQNTNLFYFFYFIFFILFFLFYFFYIFLFIISYNFITDYFIFSSFSLYLKSYLNYINIILTLFRC